MTAYVTEVCKHCGNLTSVCSDPAVIAYPQRSYCYFTAGAVQTWRRTEKAYGHPKPDSEAAHITDGLSWWMSQHDLTPDDDFFGDGRLRGGLPPPADSESDDEQR